MTGDLNIIRDARQAIKNSAREFSAAYVDYSEETSGENIRSVLDGQLRIAKKLGELETFYSKDSAQPEYPDEQTVKSYKRTMGR